MKLKKELYKKLLEYYALKDIHNAVIVNSVKDYYIVDKKYEKICGKLLDGYCKKDIDTNKLFYQHKYKVKYICALSYLIMSCLATSTPVIALEDEKIVQEELQEEYSKQNHNVETCVSPIVEESKEEEAIKVPTANEEYELYLTKYAQYFHLNPEKIIQLCKQTTNNYTDFSKIIDISTYKMNSKEAAALYFVYLFNRNDLLLSQEELGVSKEEFQTSTTPYVKHYDHIEDLVLDSTYSYSEYVGKICDLFAIQDKSILLAISYSEMGKDNPEDASRTKNNFAGLMNKDFELITFATPEAGVISMCGNYKKRYNEYTLDNIHELAGHYVKGNKEVEDEETKTWTTNVLTYYTEINENYEEYFNEEEVQQLVLKP